MSLHDHNLKRARQELHDYTEHYDYTEHFGERRVTDELRSDLRDALKFLDGVPGVESAVAELKELILEAPLGLPTADDVRALLHTLPEKI